MLKNLSIVKSVSLVVFGLFFAYLVNKITLVQYYLERVLGPDAIGLSADFEKFGIGFQGLSLAFVLLGLGALMASVVGLVGLIKSKYLGESQMTVQKGFASFGAVLVVLSIITLGVWQQSTASKYKELEKAKSANAPEYSE